MSGVVDGRARGPLHIHAAIAEEKDIAVKRFAFVVLVAVLLPFVAMADAGSPLVWGTAFHLIFGNLTIGVAEGMMLRHLFKPNLRSRTCVVLMTVANYFSAWLGMALLMEWWRPLVDRVGVEWLTAVFWCSVAVAWLFTIVAEAPFVWMALRREPHGIRRSLKASLVVQSVSYAFLFLWYSGCSRNSLMSVDIVDFETIATPGNVTVGFIGEDGKKYMGDLRLRDWKEIDAPAFEEAASASFLPSGLPPYGNVIKILADYELKWSPIMVYNDVIGLCFKDKGYARKADADFCFEWENPYVAMLIHSITQLPDGKVVFQLGGNQICIADPERKCIAVVARGRNPVVGLRHKDE